MSGFNKYELGDKIRSDPSRATRAATAKNEAIFELGYHAALADISRYLEKTGPPVRSRCRSNLAPIDEIKRILTELETLHGA